MQLDSIIFYYIYWGISSNISGSLLKLVQRLFQMKSGILHWYERNFLSQGRQPVAQVESNGGRQPFYDYSQILLYGSGETTQHTSISALLRALSFAFVNIYQAPGVSVLADLRHRHWEAITLEPPGTTRGWISPGSNHCNKEVNTVMYYKINKRFFEFISLKIQTGRQ